MKQLAAIALLAFSATGAWANADLAKKNNCLACHAADKKIVGPAYQDVAKKYAGQTDAEATLAKNIKAGGSGDEHCAEHCQRIDRPSACEVLISG